MGCNKEGRLRLQAPEGKHMHEEVICSSDLATFQNYSNLTSYPGVNIKTELVLICQSPLLLCYR